MSQESPIDALTRDICKNYPEFLRSRDLIRCGLFQSRADISLAIKHGNAPPSLRIGKRKIVFSRSELCEWLHKMANRKLSMGDSHDST